MPVSSLVTVAPGVTVSLEGESDVLYAPPPSGGDDRYGLQARIDALAAAGGGVLQLGIGTYKIAASLNLKDKVSIHGCDPEATTIQATAGVATAVLLGASGDTVTDVTLRWLTIDGNRTVFSTNVSGIQITTGARILIDGVRIEDTRNVGIALSATPDVTIRDCYLFQCGKGGTVAHGISATAGSDRCHIIGNTIIKNGELGDTGFGIRLDDCDDCKIERNYVEQAIAASTASDDVSLEPIGWTSTSLRTKCVDNTAIRGGDNGISCSGPEAVISGNTVVESCHTGIAIAATAVNSTVTGNIVKNSSQHASIAHAAISISSGGTDIVVSGNRCYDDQGVKTQTYGVQSLGTADFNIVVGNNCRGNLTGNVTLVGSNNVNANNL